MMDDWKEFTLGQLCTLRAGSAFKTHFQGNSDGDFPFIKVSDMNLAGNEICIRKANHWINEDVRAEIRTKPFSDGTTVFAKIGEALKQNRVRLLVRETIIDNNMMGAIPNCEAVDPKFFFYRLSDFDIAATATGTALPYLTVSTLVESRFLIPPLPVQRRIAGILSAYDELMENSQRRIRLLEAMARALYREWFVHLRFPGHQKIKMVDSPLGKIPHGWEVKSIANICESVSYGYTASAAREEVGPKFLRITDIVPALIDWDSVPFCKIPEDNAPKYLLKHGDIVVARTGATTGYAKRLNKLHPNTVFASYLVRARAKVGVSNRMLGILMESDEYKQFIKTNLGGSAQPQANAVVLTSMNLAVPPSSIGEKFDRLVEPMIDEAELLAGKIQNLSRTRDLLLPRLLSGQVELKTEAA